MQIPWVSRFQRRHLREKGHLQRVVPRSKMLFVKFNLIHMELLNQLQRELETKDFQRACAHAVKRLREAMPHYSWVGIYLLSEEGNELVLGPWDGPAATEHTRIPVGQGICGLAARERRTVVVDDVRKDPRYLACFPSTRSEIVVPIITSDGRVLGEIDIDSDALAAFGPQDRELLEGVARKLAECWKREHEERGHKR